MTTKPIRAEIRAAQRLINDAIGATSPKQRRELMYAALAKLGSAETATHVAQTAHDATVRRYEVSLKKARKDAAEAGVAGAELAILMADGEVA